MNKLSRRALFVALPVGAVTADNFSQDHDGAAIEAELARIAERLRILCPGGIASRMVYRDADGRYLAISIGNPDFGAHPDVPSTPEQAWDRYVSMWASAPRPEPAY